MDESEGKSRKLGYMVEYISVDYKFWLDKIDKQIKKIAHNVLSIDTFEIDKQLAESDKYKMFD
jgi:hypothetical protein